MALPPVRFRHRLPSDFHHVHPRVVEAGTAAAGVAQRNVDHCPVRSLFEFANLTWYNTYRASSAGDSETMRVHEFLQQTVEATRQALPTELRTFRSRRRYTLVQLFYTSPRIHFEIWVQGKRQRLEVGLHLESDSATNERLLSYLASRFIEVQAALGPQVELEQWTRSWGRVHEYMRYERLDEALARKAGNRLACFIMVLQPMIAEAKFEESQA